MVHWVSHWYYRHGNLNNTRYFVCLEDLLTLPGIFLLQGSNDFSYTCWIIISWWSLHCMSSVFYTDTSPASLLTSMSSSQWKDADFTFIFTSWAFNKTCNPTTILKTKGSKVSGQKTKKWASIDHCTICHQDKFHALEFPRLQLNHKGEVEEK